MDVDSEAILGWTRVAVLVLCMGWAAWFDHKERRVANEHWVVWSKPILFIWTLDLLIPKPSLVGMANRFSTGCLCEWLSIGPADDSRCATRKPYGPSGLCLVLRFHRRSSSLLCVSQPYIHSMSWSVMLLQKQPYGGRTLGPCSHSLSSIWHGGCDSSMVEQMRKRSCGSHCFSLPGQKFQSFRPNRWMRSSCIFHHP